MKKITLDNVRKLPYAAPVRDAAHALDKDVPGWERKINLETLDMENGRCCVAGQIARYWTGYDNGFGRFLARLEGASPVAFSADQRRRPAWVRAIRARLAKGTK